MKTHLHVVAAIIQNEAEILCMQRPKGKHDYTSFRWEFPGGKVEEGEAEPKALARELKEEMDYEVEIIKHYYTEEYEYPDFTITISFYLCSATTRQFNRKEHIDHQWLAPNQLHTLHWTDADAGIIAKLEAEFGKE